MVLILLLKKFLNYFSDPWHLRVFIILSELTVTFELNPPKNTKENFVELLVSTKI